MSSTECIGCMPRICAAWVKSRRFSANATMKKRLSSRSKQTSRMDFHCRGPTGMPRPNVSTELPSGMVRPGHRHDHRLSHKTVGAIRRRASGEIPQSSTRSGRDGRERPVDAAEGRIQAGRILAERPGVSLGRSPGRPGSVPPPCGTSATGCGAVRPPWGPYRREPEAAATATPLIPKAVARIDGADRVRRPPRTDPQPAQGPFVAALRVGPHVAPAAGRLHGGAARVDPDQRQRPAAPGGKLIATAARECSRAWQDFATELEQRSSRQASG